LKQRVLDLKAGFLGGSSARYLMRDLLRESNKIQNKLIPLFSPRDSVTALQTRKQTQMSELIPLTEALSDSCQ
jgi:hypothetical protein